MKNYPNARQVRGLLAQEQHDLVRLLGTLMDAEWQTPSLCAGWRVRDVVAHLVGVTTPLPTYLTLAIRHRSADKLNAHLVDEAASVPISTLLDRLDASIGRCWATALPSAHCRSSSTTHNGASVAARTKNELTASKSRNRA